MQCTPQSQHVWLFPPSSVDFVNRYCHVWGNRISQTLMKQQSLITLDTNTV